MTLLAAPLARCARKASDALPSCDSLLLFLFDRVPSICAGPTSPPALMCSAFTHITLFTAVFLMCQSRERRISMGPSGGEKSICADKLVRWMHERGTGGAGRPSSRSSKPSRHQR